MAKWPTARAFCFLAGSLPGQRHQRRTSVMERNSQSEKPRRSTVPLSCPFPASQQHAAGRLPAADESQTRPTAATTATVHKIAVIFYTMLKNQREYDATLWAASDAQRRQRAEARLKRQASRLGYQLVPATTIAS